MKRFTVKPEHVALLRRAYVGWDECEFGAPAIDPKRPYGNSDVLRDIREVLGREEAECPHCGEALSLPDDEDELTKLHRETETALQIVLATGSFEPGVYEASDYGTDWRKVEIP